MCSQEDDRRAAYNSDITYVTNSELGFDYLRDNLAQASIPVGACSAQCLACISNIHHVVSVEFTTGSICAGSA